MFSSLYVEALLADSDHADSVWQSWYGGRISDAEAAEEWARIAGETATQPQALGTTVAEVRHSLRPGDRDEPAAFSEELRRPTA